MVLSQSYWPNGKMGSSHSLEPIPTLTRWSALSLELHPYKRAGRSSLFVETEQAKTVNKTESAQSHVAHSVHVLPTNRRGGASGEADMGVNHVCSYM